MKARGNVCLPGTLLALGLSAVSANGFAQSETDTEDLGDITVTSPRVETPMNKVPYAIDLVGKDDIQQGTEQLGLDESLTKIPGIFMLNRYNFSQDLRIAIRGFGTRADFGIRGIKIYADDIPLTLPDGQGGVDAIDLASAERIEVIRGPSSSLYGTASGGVINITTEEGPETPFVEGRFSGGSYGFQKYNVKVGGQKDKLNYLFNIGRLELDGYRDHSRTESVIGNGKFIYEIDDSSDLKTIINFVDSPVADDPGGLLLSEVQADRRQARERNLTFDGGERQEQQRIGFVYRKEFTPKHEIRLRNYYTFTDFANKLPFGSPVFPFEPGGQVEFNRFFFGGGAQYTYTGDINRLIVGFDVDQQNDDRREFDNINGARGPLALSQEEDVSSIGFYAQNEQYLTETITLTTGLRYDRVEFDVTDKFFNDSPIGFPPVPDPVIDDSGTIEFDELSPLVGLLWSPRQEVNIYGNISTAFETPSTTEFANPAGGGTAGGFNQSLEPQTATNYEVGIKGVVPQWWAFSYNAAIFHIDVEDELVGFELPNNREVFQNAASSTRDGLELALSVNPIPGLTASLAYTYSRFKFDNFVDGNGNVFSDNDLPGIPRHYGQFELAYNHPSGFYGVWDTLLVGSLYADDANLTEVPGYGVSNLRMGYIKNVGDTEISPFVAINNIFDKEYFSNVRLNAFGGRFFEPAPEINAYAGISIRHNFF